MDPSTIHCTGLLLTPFPQTAHCGLTGIKLDHRSLLPEFEPRHWHIWRVFHLLLCFITFGGRSAHLAYHVHKSSYNTSITITDSTEPLLCPLNTTTVLLWDCHLCFVDVNLQSFYLHTPFPSQYLLFQLPPPLPSATNTESSAYNSFHGNSSLDLHISVTKSSTNSN